MKFKICFFVTLFLLFSSCTNRTKSDFQFISFDNDSVTINISKETPDYEVFNQLLFRGFPNSNQTMPLISTSEREIEQQFPQYFNLFFKENRYKTFITSSTKNQDGSYRILVNTKALKLDLEQNSIIRKFGY
ncbi:hypothetical protein [Halpernia frigidisoli]|uniref:Lipoprotein n=1 Tax=Halpernia frigidisoli TaxID=1125876 RepID=A0A1I3IU44_9FLAO|nr:hypothetical protein [Halpernia frigidisoli]SFI51456.1 hypothetical protein SAMN05443292_2784 [Halpernia frigidisoli]